MGTYVPKPIHEIPRYRRLARGALVLLVLAAACLAYEARGGSIGVRPWLIAVGMIAVGAGLGLWNATAIVRRADEVYEPPGVARFGPVLGLALAATWLGVVHTRVQESDQLFLLIAGAAACLTFLATMGSVVALRLRASRPVNGSDPGPPTST